MQVFSTTSASAAGSSTVILVDTDTDTYTDGYSSTSTASVCQFTYLPMILASTADVLGAFVAVPLLEKSPRRGIYMVSASLCIVCLIVLTITIPNIDKSMNSWVKIISLWLYRFFANIASAPVTVCDEDSGLIDMLVYVNV